MDIVLAENYLYIFLSFKDISVDAKMSFNSVQTGKYGLTSVEKE